MAPRLPIRALLLFEALTFIAASLVHFGVLVHGYEHEGARIPEGIIAIVLLAGLTATFIRSARTTEAAIAAQGFALLGTLVGAFTVITGAGPQTLPDILYHAGILAVLAWGLFFAVNARKMAASPVRL